MIVFDISTFQVDKQVMVKNWENESRPDLKSLAPLLKFKLKSNEEQFKCNMKIQPCLEQAGHIQETKARIIEGKFRQLLNYMCTWF